MFECSALNSQKNSLVRGILLSMLSLIFLSYPAQVLSTTNQSTNILNEIDVVDHLNKIHRAIVKKTMP